MVLSFSFTPKVMAQCDYTYDPCPTVAWWGGNDVIYLDNYPTCPISISMLYKLCPDGKMYIKIDRFSYPDPSSNADCIGLKNYLAANSNSIGDIYEKILDKTALVFFKNAFEFDTNNVNMICPNGNKSYISYLAGCTRYCRYDDDESKVTWIIPQSCGGGKCCQVETLICHDSTTGLNVSTRTVTVISSSGSICYPPFGSSCPGTITVPGGGVGGGTTHTVNHSGVSACIPSSCQE
jgi:hypothetical protein